MKLILDTNVLCRDPRLSSVGSKALLGVVGKLGASVVMPRVVYDEFQGVCRRDLIDAVAKLDSSIARVERFLTNGSLNCGKVDVESEVQNLTNNLKEILHSPRIIEYGSEYLSEAVKRCVGRIRPSVNGEEFRDVLVWLTVIDVANDESDKTVVLISGDGAFHNGTDLWPELVRECESRSIKVEFFTNISDFLQDHEEHFGFITREWLNQQLPIESVMTLADEWIERIAEGRLQRYLDDHGHPNQEVEPTGYFNIIPHNVSLNNYFVNRVSDISIRVEVEYSGLVEVECEAFFHYGYREGRFARRGTESWRGIRRSGMFTSELEISITVEVLLLDGRVSDFRVMQVVPL